MNAINTKKIWFVTGTQHLYGPEVLDQVSNHAKEIAQTLNESLTAPVEIVFQPIVKTPDEITSLFVSAGADSQCIGIITWMHTFSPAKMWINGLKRLHLPLCHLHTQYNKEIPWRSIDMDFMNLNQSAHGDREFAHLLTRMKIRRKTVVGFWKDKAVQNSLSNWTRAALGWSELQQLKVARIGDNMREVAVTEGDKVQAQIQFGFSVNGYDSDDVTAIIENLNPSEVEALLNDYESSYEIDPQLKQGGEKRESLVTAAKIELGLKKFLDQGGFKAFTDTFENLGTLEQLPGIAIQRLMEQGYGFAGEGDWKTAALVRAFKVMSQDAPGGTSFMEDYTYHFGNPSQVLGAHMLEICPSLSKNKPRCEIHPLGIGGKKDPVRLVFDGTDGTGINVSLIDLGTRFRFILNEVNAVLIENKLPNLPVARVLWMPQPSLEIAASAWMKAGGAHHTVYTQALDTEVIQDFATLAGVELICIDKNTKLYELEQNLNANDTAY